MKTERFLPPMLAAGALLAAVTANAAPATNLLVNGGLNGTATHPFSGIPSLLPGSTAIEGWTTVGNSDIAMIPVGYSTAAFEGNYYAELMGYTDNPSRFGGVTQTIATTIGRAYRLGFYMGRHPSDGAVIGIKASAGATNATFTNALGAAPWSYYSMNFTAASAATPITLIGTQGSFHIGLDAISVEALTSGVPEPGSWAMLIAGFGLTGAAARRRRAKPAGAIQPQL